MANDTSKTAKITKRLLPTSTSPKCQCTAEKYHLFAIFAVLDVSFVVNSCLNHSFFTFIFAVLLHFCSCYLVLVMGDLLRTKTIRFSTTNFTLFDKFVYFC